MLPSIWFLLWGLLWAVYFMLDGFDLGLGVLSPFLAKSETDKRIIYNVAGPFWDGNEVWLIAAGGVTFAAFPTTYAVMFSSLYSALMLVLFGLIFRGVAFEFRGKVDSPGWRKTLGCGPLCGELPARLSAGRGLRQHLCGHPHRRKWGLPGNTLHSSQSLRPAGWTPLSHALPGSRRLWLASRRKGSSRSAPVPPPRPCGGFWRAWPWPFWWPPGTPPAST